MTKFVVRRLLLGLLTVLAVTLVMFIFEQIVPDKPYDNLIFGCRGNATCVSNIRARYGADDPFFLSYLKFLKNVAAPFWSWFNDGQGHYRLAAPTGPDLGESIHLHQSVWSAISERIGATAELMGMAYLVTLVISVPIGIISAVRQYSKLDNAVTSLSFLGISLPNYWFGTLLIYAFAILPRSHGYSEIFPVGKQHANGVDSGVLDLLWHLVLPVIVLAVQFIALYSRFIRSSMLETLSQDYIRTARAKGLANRRVVIRHAFRNSLLPFITLLGIDIPSLFVGAVVTEVVFNWPGMGQLFVNSAGQSDFPALIGIAVILSSFVVVGNLIADLAYTWADPRISYG